MRTEKRMDIVNGPMIPNIIRYIIPVIASGFLQLLYNAADNIVVGRFDGPVALAAVGATGALINLLLNICFGLSTGASVAVAQAYGARDERGVHKVVHTAVLVSIIGGLVVGMVGILFSKQFLIWMGTPADVLPLSKLYLQIYFLGTPASLVYNFCASILRAAGDTKRPMIFLIISGFVNVVFNLIFVLVFHMSVAGVALATIISQYVSMVMIVVYMVRLKDCCRLELNKLKIYRNKLISIIRVGLPAGIQGTVFSLSNVVVQTALNSFDSSIIMAGSTAASQIENFIYIAMNSVYQAALTFTGQNIGAGQIRKVHKVMAYCVGIVTVIGITIGQISILLAEPLLGIFITDEPSAIIYGIERMRIVSPTYFLCGLMEVLVGCQRGMGASVTPMVVSMLGACGLRILWIATVFAASPSLTMLYLSYPVSWFITSAAHLFFYFRRHRKMSVLYNPQNAVAE
ncbi:MAG: MATE family efflux transporter [Ruminococcaceae bacterium]|nr:MATE family efflux transporter [Oscillospiraceae bacterium]